MPSVAQKQVLTNKQINQLLQVDNNNKAYLTHSWYQAWCQGKQLRVTSFPAKAPHPGVLSPTSTQDTANQQLLYLDLSLR